MGEFIVPETGPRTKPELLAWYDHAYGKSDQILHEVHVFSGSEGLELTLNTYAGDSVPPRAPAHSKNPLTENPHHVDNENFEEIAGDVDTFFEFVDEDTEGKAVVLKALGYWYDRREISDDAFQRQIHLPSIDRGNQFLDFVRTHTGFAPTLRPFQPVFYGNRELSQAAEDYDVLVSMHLGAHLHDMITHVPVTALESEEFFPWLSLSLKQDYAIQRNGYDNSSIVGGYDSNFAPAHLGGIMRAAFNARNGISDDPHGVEDSELRTLGFEYYRILDPLYLYRVINPDYTGKQRMDSELEKVAHGLAEAAVRRINQVLACAVEFNELNQPAQASPILK